MCGFNELVAVLCILHVGTVVVFVSVAMLLIVFH